MIAGPLLEAREHLLDALFIESIGLDPSGALEDEGVAVLEHGKYYGPTQNCYP